MTTEQYNRAIEYYTTYQDQVYKKMAITTDKVKPSKEDINFPNLWKGIHWNWFMSVKEDV